MRKPLLRLPSLLQDARPLAISWLWLGWVGMAQLEPDQSRRLLSKFVHVPHSEGGPTFTQETAAELGRAFEYVGLPFVDPMDKDDFEACVLPLSREVIDQNVYLNELSRNHYRDIQIEYRHSKFVRDIISFNRKP
jgi:hypothetical protein